MIALAIAAAVLGVAALCFVRLAAGPTLYDRALAAHAIAVRCAFVMALLGATPGLGHAHLMQAALLILVADFVMVAAASKFLRHRTFQTRLAHEQDGA